MGSASLRKLHYIQLFSLAAGGVFLLFLFLSAMLRGGNSGALKVISNSKEQSEEASVVVEKPSKLHLQEFYRVQVKKGKQVWEVRAKDAKYYAGENVTYVTDADVTVHRPKSEPVNLKSRSAKLYLEGDSLKKAVLEGEVTVVIEDSVTMITDLADYNSEDRVVIAPGKVVITGEGFETTGIGMEMQVDADIVKLLNDVHTRIEPNAKAPKGFGRGDL